MLYTCQAFADALASVCTTEGFGFAEQSSFAEAIAAPVARAFVFAIAGSECLGKSMRCSVFVLCFSGQTVVAAVCPIYEKELTSTGMGHTEPCVSC